MEEIPSRGRIIAKEDILNFLTAPKNAIFTLENEDLYRTYRVNKVKDGDIVFVSLLMGWDNTNFHAYQYIGLLAFKPHITFKPKKQQSYGADTEKISLSFYLLNTLIDNILHKSNFEKLDPYFWHEGKCAKCGKKLTVPESIERGMGTICLNRL